MLQKNRFGQTLHLLFENYMNTGVCRSIYYLGLQSAESNEACLDQGSVLYMYLQKKQPLGRSAMSSYPHAELKLTQLSAVLTYKWVPTLNCSVVVPAILILLNSKPRYLLQL